MRICGQCKAAENPHGKLRFLESPTGVLCANCFAGTFGEPPSSFPKGNISGLDQFVVIKCPDCRGAGSKSGRACAACARYGYVRVAKNALPVYVLKPDKPELLTEG